MIISPRGVVLYFKVTKVFGPGDGEEEQTGVYLADKSHTSLYTVKPRIYCFKLRQAKVFEQHSHLHLATHLATYYRDTSSISSPIPS